MTDNRRNRAWDDDNPALEPDDDEIAYEPFEDVPWTDDDDELNVIDLDEMDEVGRDERDENANAPGAIKPPAHERPQPARRPASQPRPASRPAPRTPAPHPPAAPADYHVLLPLTVALNEAIRALHAEAGLRDMPPPGILLAHVRTANPKTLARIVADWYLKTLPVTVATDEVLAEVIGARQYAAAWTLQPADRLLAARRALVQALATHEDITTDPAPVLDVRITIADQVAPDAYPHLLGAMQAAFEPVRWKVDAVQIFRAPPSDSKAGWSLIWDSSRPDLIP